MDEEWRLPFLMNVYTTAQSSNKARHTVCVTGSMRSGSSMITRILNICGMNLGADIDILEPDSTGNAAGYWENVKFIYANKVIMQSMREDSVTPLQQNSTQTNPKILSDASYRTARKFLQNELKGDFVGWKDPNNSMTLKFWKNVVPDLRVVLCVRNPYDVAMSLLESPFFRLDIDAGLRLWEQYNTSVLNIVPSQDLIISRYENYFTDPEREIHKLLAELGIKSVNSKTIKLAATSIQPSLWHYRNTKVPTVNKVLGQKVNLLYQKLLLL